MAEEIINGYRIYEYNPGVWAAERKGIIFITDRRKDKVEKYARNNGKTK